MSIVKTDFGTVPSGDSIELYTITNQSGASIAVSTLGAGLVKAIMPDCNGRLGDCVLGYDEPTPYTDPDNGYQGLIVGRVANRIAGGRFSIDGIEYNVPKNQDNCLCLHGAGRLSLNAWKVEEICDNGITMSFFSPDMQDGFPGNFKCAVKYLLTDDNIVRIEYKASSDRKTVVNLTNHSYFNLACDESNVHDHYLQVNADCYIETDDHSIPTGNLKSVKGNELDFTKIKRIGDEIDKDVKLLTTVGGYDHCLCLNNKKGEFAFCSRLEERKSGRVLEVYTDMPSVQIYAANCTPDSMGKNGLKTGFRRGICMETQLYPDSPNHPDFPSCYIDENNPLVTATEFRFSTIK